MMCTIVNSKAQLNHFPGHSLLALLLASNYFAFQIEPFEEEYSSKHSTEPLTRSISSLSLNWESFDKENAPKAFVFRVDVRIEPLFLLRQEELRESVTAPQFQPVRDKSPPPAA